MVRRVHRRARRDGRFSRASFARSSVRFRPGPHLNETAPDFTLRLVKSPEEVTLSKLVGPKPVVLVFGNFTCRPFRGEAGDLEKLYQRYKNRATFLMVYVREAHPTDGWRMEVNDRLGVTVRQPRTYDERDGVAQSCLQNDGYQLPDASWTRSTIPSTTATAVSRAGFT